MRDDIDKEFMFPPPRPYTPPPKRNKYLVPLLVIALFISLVYFYLGILI